MTEIRPQSISKEFIMSRISLPTLPIESPEFKIPNISIPKHMAKKPIIKATTEDTILNIRMILNNVTGNNINSSIVKMRQSIVSGVSNPKELEDIADEIYACILVSPDNVVNGIMLVDSVAKMCVKLETGLVSKNIGVFVVDKCRNDIIRSIDLTVMMDLCILNDYENVDDLDVYTRKKHHIMNLIQLICLLYKRRDDPSNIRIGSVPVYTLINKIMDSYNVTMNTCEELGDPYSDEGCRDEQAYDDHRKIAVLYSEFLYEFMSIIAQELGSDVTVYKENKVSNVVSRFRDDIVPTISESYLISKCRNIKY